MQLISLSCNKCGAPLEAPEGANFLTCGYCGSRLAVQRNGSAYYTQVLDQIDHKTTQILNKVDTLVDMNVNVQWETCEITWERKAITWAKMGNWFVASALGVNGRFEAVRSDPFRESNDRIRNTFLPKQTKDSLAAFDQLLVRLAQDGREPVVQEGRYWFSRYFRRRVKK